MEPKGLGKSIFDEKYAMDGEDWHSACIRVANAVGAHDSDYIDAFTHAVLKGLFMPGGRIWYGAGRIKQQMLNCFVVPTGDSREAWGTTLHDLTVVTGTGGGVGFNFTPIRPKGAPIGGVGGRATGPVSLMSMLDAVSGQMVGGASRRAAMMMCLSIDHPDILDFIDTKLNRGELNNANVSIVIPPTIEPETIVALYKDDGRIALRHDGRTYGELPIRPFMQGVIKNAIQSGEPGILNQYLAEKESNISYAHPLTSTNPCVTGDTQIMTVDGPRSFTDLVEDGKDVLVYSWHPKTKKPVIRWMRNPRLTKKNAETLEIEFDSGLIVKCTPDHHLYTFRGKKVKARNLKVGQSIRAWSMSEHRDGHLRVHGWDSNRNAADHQWVARMVYECCVGPIPEGYIVHHKDENKENNEPNNLEAITPVEHNVIHYPERKAAGFDGHSPNHKVVAIRQGTPEDVYNGTVDDSHTYIIVDPEPVAGVASGIVSANCGEIWLPDYGCCDLGSLVLPNYVVKRMDGASFDWDLFAENIRLGVRFLDNVLDVNYYPIPAIEHMCQAERRIGLGVMGLHSMLLDLGMKYDSEEAFLFVDKVFHFLKMEAYKASIELAKEKGPFPLYDARFLASPFVRRLPKEIRSAIAESGIRNCALLTVAPTGTTSMVHGITSGIEPLFAPAYFRRRNVDAAEAGKFDVIKTLVVHADFLDHPDIAQGAYDISVWHHLEMQKIVQYHVDNAVSKTINVDKDVEFNDLMDATLEYLPYLKGFTVYQEGSREDEPLEAVRLDMVPALLQTWDGEIDYEGLDSMDCVNGVCTI